MATLTSLVADQLAGNALVFDRLRHAFIELNREFKTIDATSDLFLDHLAKACHKNRASCISFGAEKLWSALSELEAAAIANDRSTVESLLPRVMTTFDDTTNAIDLFAKGYFSKEKKSA